MKRLINAFLFTALLVFLLSSCATPGNKIKTVKTLGITYTGIVQQPLLVDLEVKETKVTGMSSGKYNGNIASFAIDNTKNAAVEEALKNAGDADVLVEPKFDININGTIITVVVKGYPAFHRNFRPATQEVSDTSNVNIVQDVKIYEPVQNNSTINSANNKKKK